MSRIRSKNTKIEKLVFRELRKRKIYFQRHYKKCAGNPDIALPGKKIAIFIDGDFWHGYNFKKTKSRLPKKYWQEKIQSNIQRDRKNVVELKKEGWQVLRIWEYEIEKDITKAVNKIQKLIEK